MEYLYQHSNQLISRVPDHFQRYLYKKINWNSRLIGIKGSRGTGKTTLLLQKAKELNEPEKKVSYWSLDDFYFSTKDFHELVFQFYENGGRVLFLDEIHKLEQWSRHLKNMYDSYPDLKVVFSGSSMINIYKGRIDLSRRAVMYELLGLSYREFLNLRKNNSFPVIKLNEVLDPGIRLQELFPNDFNPIYYFREYMERGYFPIHSEDEDEYSSKIREIIQFIADYEIAELGNIDIKKTRNIVKLLGLISINVPFKPNISKLSQKLRIERHSLYTYLDNLEKARIISQIHQAGKGFTTLQKPEKIYLQNTNYVYALSQEKANTGNIRETFFANQLAVNHELHIPKAGDFLIDNKWTVEIGGRNKTDKQIKNLNDAFVVKDDISFPVNGLPLWVFGFLY